MDELGSVCAVDVDGALAIRDGEFRLAAERDCSGDGAGRGVDGGGICATTVESENALAGGVVDDGVGIGVGLYGADRFQRFEIEDGDGVRAAIADETATEAGSDGDAVHALRVGNVAFDGVGVGVHDHGVRAVRDVDAAGGAVDVDIGPAVLAGDGNGRDDVIAGGAGLCSGVGKDR